MRIEGEWLSAPSLRAVFALLGDAGHSAYVVGGAVRNAVMGLPVSDMDIATDARPERVMALAGAAGLRAVATGLDHGTVTVISGDVPFEITTFRQDVETDGRRAKVAFTDDLEADARRRDFTMNALYAGSDGVVIDPVGGIGDARAKRVRFIEDAGRRIEEDYLRILRFFRFSAVYGADSLDAEALAAIATHLGGLEGLASERVGAEMRKLLAADDPSLVLAAMARVGVLERVLPGAVPDMVPVLVHHETGFAPDAMRRLAALGGESPATHLRLSRAEAKRLETLRGGMASTAGPGELGYRLGADAGRDVLLLRAAMGAVLPDGWPDDLEHGANAVFPVSAGDLMPGLSGKALGDRLKALEAEWIGTGFSATREDLL